MKEPAAFMSYAHRDNKDGRLTKLREGLSHEVSVRTGEDFEIFQDRRHILWGQNWKVRIEESLDEVTFLIPVVTPR
jgi:cobaltochelatase CobT